MTPLLVLIFCISYFLNAVTKYVTKNKQTNLFFLQFQGRSSIMTMQAWQPEQEVDGLVTLDLLSQSQEDKMLVLCLLPPFYSFWDQPIL